MFVLTKKNIILYIYIYIYIYIYQNFIFGNLLKTCVFKKKIKKNKKIG